MSTSTERIFYEIDGDSSGLDRASGRAARGLKDVDRSFDGVKKAAQALGGPVGQAVMAVDDLKDSIAFLGGPAGVMAAGVAAAGLFAAGLVKLTLAAAENSKELEALGLITAEQGRAMRETADTIGLAEKAWQAFSFTIAEQVSGAIQGLTRWTLIASMALADLFSGDGINSLDEYVRRVLVLEDGIRALAATAAGAGDSASDAAERVGFQLTVVGSKVEKADDAFARLEKGSVKSLNVIREAGVRSGNAVANAWLSGIDNILGAMGTMVEEGTIAAKAIASLQVVVSTAAAIMNALATPPFPLGLALGVTAAVAGAVQLANVWSAKPGQKSSPKAPSASMPSSAGSGRDTQRSSNREGSGPTRSGGDGRGTTPTAILQFRHRMYDDVTNDALHRGDSPLAKAIGGPNPHRSH